MAQREVAKLTQCPLRWACDLATTHDGVNGMGWLKRFWRWLRGDPDNRLGGGTRRAPGPRPQLGGGTR